jgi:hypothetical protein
MDETGLAKIGNAYFMIRSKNGKTHAINPKTQKPYCSWKPKWREWEPTDELPDEKHKPACKVCLAHYDDPIKERLQEIKKELMEQIDDYLWLRVMLKDVDGIGRFTDLIAKYMREEVKEQIAKNSVKAH